MKKPRANKFGAFAVSQRPITMPTTNTAIAFNHQGVLLKNEFFCWVILLIFLAAGY